MLGVCGGGRVSELTLIAWSPQEGEGPASFPTPPKTPRGHHCAGGSDLICCSPQF